MGLHSLMQRSRWGRFPQVDAGYSHASSVQDNASIPCMFLSARNSTIVDKQLNQPVAVLFSATASLFKYTFHPYLAWQNTEYFQILYHKWRIFCKLLDVWINFTEDIINTSVMFYHFQHEGEYCNSDHILWVDGLYIIPLGVVTCHKNYASNICDRSANYFYSGLRDTPWQYLNIWHVIISHSHMHLCNTYLQCFQLLFQLSLLLPVKSQLLPMLLYFAIHLFLQALLQWWER